MQKTGLMLLHFSIVTSTITYVGIMLYDQTVILFPTKKYIDFPEILVQSYLQALKICTTICLHIILYLNLALDNQKLSTSQRRDVS